MNQGATWSHVLKRGTSLRITDMQGGANLGALFYNFECPAERYNMPDTLKVQQIAYLTKGVVLYSDMGRILCSIVDDSVGWHDPLGGCSDAALVREKYGESRYQESRNQCFKNARDGFLIELEKWGLGPARSDRQRELLQPRDGERGRMHALPAGQLDAALVGGTARRDECLDYTQHLPASSRSLSKIRSQGGENLGSQSDAAGGRGSLPLRTP